MSMKRKSKYKPENGPVSPYQKAAQEWDDRIGSARVQAKNWRITALIALFLCILLGVGSVYVNSQPRQVHIVEVNPDGSAVYRGAGGQSYNSFKAGEPSIRYHLNRFIQDTRMISSDRSIIKKNWIDAYRLVTANGRNTLNDYVQKNDPFARAASERIGVSITAMVPVSENTWQVDWVESKWDSRGVALGDTRWRGMFTVVIQRPTTDAQLASNPIGFYVDEIHWSRIQH